MNYRAFVIDLDGCVYLGDTMIHGVDEAIRRIKELGIKILYLTNNSGYTSQDYCRKLRRLGIECDPEEILTSGEATARYILETSGKSKILPITGDGFKRYCMELGHEVLSLSRWSEAEYVVVGLDREINYQKLTAGLRALLSGARFIATNADKTYPSPEGLEPGAGAIVAALREAANKDPIVVGKPSKIIMKIALKRLGAEPHEILVVGDRFETDIMAGKNIGADTALVLTGVTRMEELERIPRELRPDYIAQSLSELIKNLLTVNRS